MKYRKLLLKFTWTIILILGISWLSSAQRDSLTIEKALDIAEENNPSLRSSKLSLERSQLLLDAQRAALKTNMSFDITPVTYSNRRSFDTRLSQWYDNESFGSSGSFRMTQTFIPTNATISLRENLSWQNSSSIVEGETRRNKAFNNNLTLNIEQPIFTHNTVKMTLRTLETDYENAGINYALQRLTNEVSISRQFYAVYSAQEDLKTYQDELENTQRSYEITKSKVEALLAKEEELYQAEANLASAQSSVTTQLANLEDAKDALKQALGMSLKEDICVKADIDVKTVYINFDKAMNSAMASRMELRQRELDLELGEMQMVRTKALNEFKGNISLSLGIQGVNERFGNMYDTPTQSPSISIGFQIPIFDWGEKKMRVKAQETAQTITKLSYENQIINIESSIRSLIRQIENSRNQIVIMQKTVENTQRTYNLYSVRYSAGEINGLQYSQYQAQLSTSRMRYAQSIISYRIAILNLKIATLYDFEKDESVIPVKGL